MSGSPANVKRALETFHHVSSTVGENALRWGMRNGQFALVFALHFAALGACRGEAPRPEVAVARAPNTLPMGASSVATSSSAVPPPPPSSAVSVAVSDTCQTDADCTLSTFGGCCALCPCARLRATTTSREASERRACEGQNCPARDGADVKCMRCADPTKEGMHARCIAASCTLVETSASPTVACTSDDDCWLDDRHRPIPRPHELRGKTVRPCKDSEHAPACQGSVCIARHFKC